MLESLAGVTFLAAVALSVYGLVFVTHALRRRITQALFFALLGCLAAITVWVTDTGTRVQVGGLTFLFGSVVFFVAVMLGVFLAYVFDGTHSGQMAIASAVVVTILTPVFAQLTAIQMTLPGTVHGYAITQPSARMYAFSAGAMLADFLLMAIVWQYLANSVRGVPVVLRVFAALLAALWLDVLIFTIGVFRADPAFWGILRANILSRLVLAVLLAPVVALYMHRELQRHGIASARRPLLSILQSSTRTEHELSLAQREIERRREAERALEDQLRFRESLLAAIPYPVFYKDAQGRYLGGNRAFEELGGMLLEGYRGRTAEELYPPHIAEQYRREDERLLREPGIHQFETTTTAADGAQRDVILCKSTYLDSEGRIVGVLGIIIDITERKQLEARLEALAMRDSLTGAFNRRFFVRSLEDAIAEGQPFSVILLDADRFKSINDTHGHNAGDEVLKRLASLCAEGCRDTDVVSRLGGEEFAILVRAAAAPAAAQLAEKLRRALEEEIVATSAGGIRLTASFGVAGHDPACAGPTDLLQRADAAMYRGKRAGGNRVEVHQAAD